MTPPCGVGVHYHVSLQLWDVCRGHSWSCGSSGFGLLEGHGLSIKPKEGLLSGLAVQRLCTRDVTNVEDVVGVLLFQIWLLLSSALQVSFVFDKCSLTLLLLLPSAFTISFALLFSTTAMNKITLLYLSLQMPRKKKKISVAEWY